MFEREPSTSDYPDERDVETEMPKEETATAPTPPDADIRTMRPLDDPESLGNSEFYEGSEDPGSSAPPPVQISEDPD